MWRASPQDPGLRWRHPGISQTSCAFPPPIGPLADWQIIPRTPFNPLQLAPADVMVCTPCYGNISHSHSQSHSDILSLTHTHPYSRSSSHPYRLPTLLPTSPVFAFSGLSNLPLAAPRPPQSHFSTQELLHGPSHAPLLTNIFLVRYCVYTQSMCIVQTRFRLLCPVYHAPSPSYTAYLSSTYIHNTASNAAQ